MLAFLLPIKVILLAGSSGVPRYFRLFVSPENRDAAIIVLATAAVVSYILTLVLEARSKRLTERGGDRLLAASGVMSVVANQRDQMQGFYARFTGIAADMIFFTVGLTALLLLNPVLAGYVLALVLCFYLFTAWALSGVTALNRTRLSDAITGRLGSYLGVLSSIAFLSSFLVILYPFVAGTNGNILVAIISVVLLRRMLGALTSAIRDGVSLAGQKVLIDTLVFPEHRLEAVEGKDQRTLRDLFGRAEREEIAAAELAELAGEGTVTAVEWRDPALRGTADFAITLRREGEPDRHLRQLVLPPRQGRLIENETLLFSHVERDAVGAPPLLKRFSRGDYECLVYAAGAGEDVERREWPQIQTALLADLWSVEPPPALVKTYASSHAFLHERLGEAFALRMEIAVDRDEEAQVLARFVDALGALRERIGALPLCLVNQRLRADQSVRRAEGGVYAFGWGEWSLEPAGAGLGNLLVREGELEAFLDNVRERRPALRAEAVTLANIELARDAGLLERAVQRGTMKAALAIAGRILEELEGRTSTRLPSGEDALADEMADEDDVSERASH